MKKVANENLNAKLALNYDDGDSFEAAGNDGSFNGFLRLDASF